MLNRGLTWFGPQVIAALSAGLAALVIVILVSLPLQSPHDALMNSATIAVAGAVTSIALAFAWRKLAASSASESRRVLQFGTINLAALATAVIAAFLVQSLGDLERAVSFITPLVAIQFIGITGLTPAFDRFLIVARWFLIFIAIAVIALGATLAEQGDQKSGRLSLPERSD